MNEASQHTFQVLTKRPSRASQLSGKVNWTPNIWMGTSVESERWEDRVEILKRIDAQVKFLSLEPLLGPLSNLDLQGIDWVKEIRDNCLATDVPFFFKQWGGVFKKRTGRVLDGRTWDEMPRVDGL